MAEKLETVVRFGTGNTRTKDLIDLWSLKKADIELNKIKSAVNKCFKNRGSKIQFKAFDTILADVTFRKFINESIARNYGYLNLPPAEILCDELIHWVSEIINF